jgi:nicotinamide-nucleotide amidase
MNAEILSVGTELLLGNTTNTDARDVSECLSQLGVNVFWHTVVGDNPARLTECVEIAKKRADLIVTTGGLGPTCDDLTKQVLAKAFGLKLYFDAKEAAGIRAWFEGRGHPMTENNLQQAYLPEGCTVLHNDWGTAPGCAFEKDGVRVVMLPGPPRECRAMFTHRVMPWLRSLSEGEIVSHNVRVFGKGESAVEALLRDRMNAMTNPTLAPYAKEGEMLLRVTAKAATRDEAEAMMRPVLDELRSLLGDIVYGVDAESLEAVCFELLRARGQTLATAESCTGGLLGKRLTDLPGVSAVYKGGAVVYAAESKTAVLGVPASIIEEKGVVSREVALSLAENVRERFGADYGLGVTGLAGPDGDGVHPVGTVFVALAAPDGSFVRALRLGSGRERVRTSAAHHAFDMLRRCLTGLEVVPEEYR